MYRQLSSFGASPDARQIKDAAIDAGLTSLTSQTAEFTVQDVGKSIVVSGAGSNGAKLSTTIAAVTSATEIVLASAASTSVTGKGATFGTDCGPALQTALNELEDAGGGALHVDGAFMLVTPVVRQFFTATRTELLGHGASDRLYIATAPNATAITIQSARSLVIDGLNFVGTPDERADAWRTLRFEDCELFFRNCGFFGLASALQWNGSVVSTNHCHVSVHDTYFGGCAGSNGVDNPTFDLQSWKSCDFQRTQFIDYGSIGGFEHSKTGYAVQLCLGAGRQSAWTEKGGGPPGCPSVP
jgi:hypothetical protein